MAYNPRADAFSDDHLRYQEWCGSPIERGIARMLLAVAYEHRREQWLRIEAAMDGWEGEAA